MHVLLETERLLLRRLTPDDLENLVELDSDPEVMRHLNGGEPTPREVMRQELLPAFLRYDDRLPGFGMFAAIERSSEDFLGWFGLRPVQGDARRVSLGYRLRRAAWGRGYATEGARALIRLGFTELGVHRVIATTYQDNVASQRVMEKAGLRLVRRYRLTPADLEREGIYHVSSYDLWDGDDLEYALDKADWEQREAGG
jgi:RimJ/RimL family protein N-acetyltransferase